MARQIYIVNAMIVDANGTFNILSGYPKAFDSRNYDDDIIKAQRRAEGDFSDVWGAMCKRDDRKVQTVTLYTVDGFKIDRRSTGWPIEEEAQPEPEPQPVEQE